MAKNNPNNTPEMGNSEGRKSWIREALNKVKRRLKPSMREALNEAKRRLKLIAIIFVAILISVGASFLLFRKATTDDGPTEPAGVLNGHHYVDLGLSVKWATENVGASAESPTGELYAWGEVESKEAFTEEGYTPVDKKTLYIKRKANHDAATAVMGRGWYMPTDKEMNELIEKCTWERIVNDTLNGYRITGTNGNYIFMPIDATAHYWSSHVVKEDRANAYTLHLGDTAAIVATRPVHEGYHIRAVTR